MGAIVYLIAILVFGALGSAVSKERKGLGFVLGFLLGPLGVLIAAIALRQ